MYLKTRSLAAISIMFVLTGCGSKYPPVSGTITVNGKPVSKIQVVFSPKPTQDSANTGPVSSAITDENGRFSLKTRHGDWGAVAGKHAVGFRWCDIHGDSITALNSAWREARKNAPEEAKEIKERIESIKQKLKNRPQLPKQLETEFELDVAGTTEANFELTELNQNLP